MNGWFRVAHDGSAHCSNVAPVATRRWSAPISGACCGAPVFSGAVCATVAGAMRPLNACSAPIAVTRSEEHTSELQSLMRISYAVFCLKKKKKSQHIQYI